MSAAQQIARATEALGRWPWIPAIEDEHGLPRWLLLAVGLRETGLDPSYASGHKGDGGYAYGPWQFDLHPQNRNPARQLIAARIGAGDVQFAAEIAAATLRANFDNHGHDWINALNVYNSGQTKTEHTAHGDYGPAVWAALGLLQRSLGPLPNPAPLPAPGPVAPQPTPGLAPTQELDVQLANIAKTAFLSAAAGGVPGLDPKAGWELHADGGIDAVFGAPFWGGYFNLPADARNTPRLFLGLTPRRDGDAGYEIHGNDGAYYTFGPGLNGFG